MEELLLPLVFIGGFLFLLMWETKSQYALYFYIVIMLHGILGYQELYHYFLKPHMFEKRSIILLILFLTVSMIAFKVSFKPYLISDNEVYKEYISYGNSYEWFEDK